MAFARTMFNPVGRSRVPVRKITPPVTSSAITSSLEKEASAPGERNSNDRRAVRGRANPFWGRTTAGKLGKVVREPAGT
jgi:hypothetical protein